MLDILRFINKALKEVCKNYVSNRLEGSQTDLFKEFFEMFLPGLGLKNL